MLEPSSPPFVEAQFDCRRANRPRAHAYECLIKLAGRVWKQQRKTLTVQFTLVAKSILQAHFSPNFPASEFFAQSFEKRKNLRKI